MKEDEKKKKRENGKEPTESKILSLSRTIQKAKRTNFFFIKKFSNRARIIFPPCRQI